MGLGFLLTSWIARYLGPTNFGALNYAVAFVGVFGFLSTLGLDGIIVRDLVRSPAKSEEILGSSLVLRLVGAALVFAICTTVICLSGQKSSDETALVAIIGGANIFTVFGTMTLCFQALEVQRYAVIASLAAFMISGLIRVWFVLHHAGVIAFAWCQMFQAGVNAVILIYIYRQIGGRLSRLKFSFSCAKGLIGQGWLQMLSALSIAIYMRIDQVMITHLRGSAENGIYSAATRISEIWYFVPGIIVPAVFPEIIRSRERSAAEYNNRLLRLFSIMAFIFFIIAIPISLASERIVSFAYGASFDGAARILQVHIWAALFVFWGVAQEPWNVSEGLFKLTLGRTLFGALSNILLNLVWIPKYGGIGAAYATLLAYGVATILGNLFHPKTRPVFNLQLKSLAFFLHLGTERLPASRAL